jgi:uncharacterized surface protein with fasciclin (FAS1) repeats
MLGRMSRGLFVAVVALAFSGFAAAQEPKKPEAKPEAKPEMKKPEAAAPQEKKAEGKDLLETAKDAKLATFCELVKLAGLEKDLQGPMPMTVFAPTDDAFKAYKGLDDLKKDKAKLADFLKGHIVAKKVDVKKDKTAKPLAGAEIALAEKDGKTTVNDKIKVAKDLTASNGVIFVVDGVIAAAEKKPEMKKEEPKKDAPKPEVKKEEPKKPEQPKKEGEKKPEPKPGEKKG